MNYINKILLPNENIIYVGNRSLFSLLPIVLVVSWIIPLPLIVLGIIINSNETDKQLDFTFFLTFIGVGLFLFFIFYLLAKLIISKTELAITNKRVVAKFGIIRRDTVELRLDKIESVSVEQSILGRFLNYGSVIIHGYGGSKTPIIDVTNPLNFKRELEQLYDRLKADLAKN